jgi:hypothetical protein
VNDVVAAVVALGVLAPAAVTHVVRQDELGAAIAAHRVLPMGGRGRALATVVVLLELAVCALLAIAIWRDDFRTAGVALGALGAAFVVYVAALRRRRFAGDCGCSAFEAPPTRWSYLPGTTLLLAGIVLAADVLPTASAFAAPSGTAESVGAALLAFTVGFLVWMFPASTFRVEEVR